MAIYRNRQCGFVVGGIRTTGRVVIVADRSGYPPGTGYQSANHPTTHTVDVGISAVSQYQT